MTIELKDSFALGDRLRFKLSGIYNFEELYGRYTHYLASQMQQYGNHIKNDPGYQISQEQYSLIKLLVPYH